MESVMPRLVDASAHAGVHGYLRGLAGWRVEVIDTWSQAVAKAAEPPQAILVSAELPGLPPSPTQVAEALRGVPWLLLWARPEDPVAWERLAANEGSHRRVVRGDLASGVIDAWLAEAGEGGEAVESWPQALARWRQLAVVTAGAGMAEEDVRQWLDACHRRWGAGLVVDLDWGRAAWTQALMPDLAGRGDYPYRSLAPRPLPGGDRAVPAPPPWVAGEAMPVAERLLAVIAGGQGWTLTHLGADPKQPLAVMALAHTPAVALWWGVWPHEAVARRYLELLEALSRGCQRLAVVAGGRPGAQPRWAEEARRAGWRVWPAGPDAGLGRPGAGAGTDGVKARGKERQAGWNNTFIRWRRR